MVNSPAYAWLEDFEQSEKDVKEDSRYHEWYDCVATLVWLDDDLTE